MKGGIEMTKYYDSLIKIVNIFIAIAIILVNLYALISSSTSLPIATITNILFISFFALLGVKSIKDKSNYGYLYLVFMIVMALILLIRYLK